MGDGAGSAIDAVFQRHKASQRFGADLEAQALAAERRGGRSGDADLPAREPLHERRAKFDSVRARQQVRAPQRGGATLRRAGAIERGQAGCAAAAPPALPAPFHPPPRLQMALDEDGPEELGGGGRRRQREEDAFYSEAKAAAGAPRWSGVLGGRAGGGPPALPLASSRGRWA